MDEDLIEEMLVALIEDYSYEELEDEKFMKQELLQIHKLTGEKADILLKGAREIKKLRAGYIPDWQQLLIMH